MDLRRLTYFVAVAEEQHFARAAARLHMTTPPLSQRIRELEAELGVELFERTTRSVHLTPAGSRLLHEARSALRAVDRFTSLAETLRRASDATTQPLKVAYCHGSEHVALTAAHKKRLSVGIARAPIPQHDELASRPLARVPYDHVAIPPSHPLAANSVITVTDLDQQPVILVEHDEAPTAHDSTIAYCAAHDVQPAWVTMPATQVERMLDSVAVGSVIGWLNAWQAAHVRRDDVVVRPLRPIERFDEFHLVWRVDDHSKSVEEFVAIAMEAAEDE
jgi:DNA-binding transcriptional LysR family regulator